MDHHEDFAQLTKSEKKKICTRNWRQLFNGGGLQWPLFSTSSNEPSTSTFSPDSVSEMPFLSSTPSSPDTSLVAQEEVSNDTLFIGSTEIKSEGERTMSEEERRKINIQQFRDLFSGAIREYKPLPMTSPTSNLYADSDFVGLMPSTSEESSEDQEEGSDPRFFVESDGIGNQKKMTDEERRKINTERMRELFSGSNLHWSPVTMSSTDSPTSDFSSDSDDEKMPVAQDDVPSRILVEFDEIVERDRPVTSGMVRYASSMELDRILEETPLRSARANTPSTPLKETSFDLDSACALPFSLFGQGLSPRRSLFRYRIREKPGDRTTKIVVSESKATVDTVEEYDAYAFDERDFQVGFYPDEDDYSDEDCSDEECADEECSDEDCSEEDIVQERELTPFPDAQGFSERLHYNESYVSYGEDLEEDWVNINAETSSQNLSSGTSQTPNAHLNLYINSQNRFRNGEDIDFTLKSEFINELNALYSSEDIDLISITKVGHVNFWQGIRRHLLGFATPSVELLEYIRIIIATNSPVLFFDTFAIQHIHDQYYHRSLEYMIEGYLFTIFNFESL